MLKRDALVIASIVAVAGGSPSLGETPDAAAAREALISLRSCETSDLPPILDLIKKYRKSDDVDVKVVVAEAESRVTFVYWFQDMKPEARSNSKKIVQAYENQADERLQVIAAQARLLLAQMEPNGSKKRAYVEPLILRYKDSKNLGLLYSYGQALDTIAGIERGTEKDDDGRRLAEEAHEVFDAVAKQRPPVTDHTGVNDVCV